MDAHPLAAVTGEEVVNILKRGLPLMAVAMLVVTTSCSTTHVEVLAASYLDSDGPAFARESADYKRLRDIISPGRHLVVTAISDNSFFEPPVVDVTVPGQSLFGENPRQLDDRVKAAQQTFDDGLGALAQRMSGEPRTEIIAAISASGVRFASDPSGTKKILIVLSRGYEQSGIIDMNDSRHDLLNKLEPIIDSLVKRGRMPTLPQVTVCMGSVSVGLNGNGSAQQFVKMRTFWRVFFQKAGATLESYGPSLTPKCINQ
jgi:hypothetical protein